MGGNFDYQCTSHFAGGVQSKYFFEHERVSSVLFDIFSVFRCAWSFRILLHQCGNRADDSNYCISDLFCDIYLRKENKIKYARASASAEAFFARKRRKYSAVKEF